MTAMERCAAADDETQALYNLSRVAFRPLQPISSAYIYI